MFLYININFIYLQAFSKIILQTNIYSFHIFQVPPISSRRIYRSPQNLARLLSFPACSKILLKINIEKGGHAPPLTSTALLCPSYTTKSVPKTVFCILRFYLTDVFSYYSSYIFKSNSCVPESPCFLKTFCKVTVLYRNQHNPTPKMNPYRQKKGKYCPTHETRFPYSAVYQKVKQSLATPS